MNPSSFSTRAMLRLTSVAGISTKGRSIRLALRMRVSMSAIVSVIMGAVLPTRFLDAWDQAVAGHVAEADAADAELPIHRPRPSTQLAAQAHANLLARQHLHFIGRALTRLQLRELFAK